MGSTRRQGLVRLVGTEDGGRRYVRQPVPGTLHKRHLTNNVTLVLTESMLNTGRQEPLPATTSLPAMVTQVVLMSGRGDRWRPLFGKNPDSHA